MPGVPIAKRPSRFALLAWAACLLAAGLARAQGAVPAVSVAEAVRAPIVREVPVTGTVVSPRSSQISPEVSGRLSAVPVEVGDRVEEGAVLAVLDPELARLDLERARAATREAREALADARRRLADAERLSAGNAVSESQLLTLRSEVEVDRAVLGRLEAEEARQSALLERHEVRAPFAGAVAQKLANAGEWVEPGTTLVELVSTEGLRIDFQVPQEFYPQVRVEGAVDVALDAAPGRFLAGRVTAVVPRSDPTARTFLMLVVLAEPGAPLIPGMSARARLRLGDGREGVVVPRDALLRHPDGRVTVFVLEPDGPARGDAALAAGEGSGPPPGSATVAERRVEIGGSFDGRVEIVSGLESGRLVVVVGNEGLQDGQRVRVRGAPADV